MPLILSVTFAAGVLLIFMSSTERWTAPRAESRATLTERLDDYLRRNGVIGIAPREFVVLCVVSGVAATVFVQFALGWPAVSGAAFAVGLLLPGWYFHNRHERRREAIQLALADAVDALRASVRTGMSVEEAVTSLARNGPDILRPTFGDLARELRISGFDQGVRRAREELADPVFDTVAAALLMSHRVGGRNLSTVLDSLSRSVRQSINLERELRAHQAKNVLSARIIAALPLVLILAVRGLNPDYLDVFSSANGQTILALCLVSVAVGYAGMLRATRLPLEERVLQ
ncbi:type II secretion system F family protein [bacterium]|nr:type II secretion system F family protein [bacterium]